MNDDELEAMFRQGLSAHADDVTDAGGHADAARAGVRRRRRLRTGIVTGVVAIALVPVAVLASGSDEPAHPIATTHPSSWRAESYNGVQLWVPNSWGWGGVPARTDDGVLQCGAGAFSETIWSRLIRYPVGNLSVPYVGRPAMMSDLCSPPTAEAAHVWFDSPLPVGSTGTQKTFWVSGLTMFKITVADANRAESRTIIDSIEQAQTDASGCPMKEGLAPLGQRPLDPTAVTSVSVCLYFQDRGRPWLEYLFYSARVTTDPTGVMNAITSGGPGRGVQSDIMCDARGGFSLVSLIAHAGDRTFTYFVGPNICGGQELGYNGLTDFHLLTKESVRLWAINGVGLYASGGEVGNRLTPYLPG